MQNYKDFVVVIKKILNNKRKLLQYVFGFGILGLVVAFTSPKEYSASVVVIPVTNDSQDVGTNLGGLASIAGIKIDSKGSTNIPPSLYPNLIKSEKFLLSLKDTNFSTSLEDSLSYDKFIDKYGGSSFLGVIKKYTIGLPRLIYTSTRRSKAIKIEQKDLNNRNSDGLIYLNPKDEGIINGLASRISLKVDEKDGIVELRFNMPTAESAAIMVKRAQELLQEEITDFKIKRIREELDFTQRLFEEKEASYQMAQKQLSRFLDANQNMTSSVSLIERTNLENNLELSLELFRQVSQKLESQKIKLQENTPSFAVLQPIVVPNTPEKPNKKFILIGFVLFGLFFGVSELIAREFIARIKSIWNKVDNEIH